jgi:D-alanine-D-alanine ligase
MSKTRVAIVYGGRSTEHEISILSARNILASLDKDRFEVTLIGIDKEGKWSLQDPKLLLDASTDPRQVKLQDNCPPVAMAPRPTGGMLEGVGAPKIDVIFPILHGPMGEDGTMQGIFELAEIPYVGSGVLGSSVSMDKDSMKRVLRDAGIPVGPFQSYRRYHWDKKADTILTQIEELGFPVYVKPANQGSSVGIKRVAAASELREAMDFAFQFDTKVVVESEIIGREIECSVLGNDNPIASIAGEVIVHAEHGFYSYEAKYVDANGAGLEVPAKVSEETLEKLKEVAIDTFLALDCSGLSRVDFFVQDDGNLVVNEINTLPGFTNVSMYPMLWQHSGIEQKELLSRLVDLAIERFESKQSLRRSME